MVRRSRRRRRRMQGLEFAEGFRRINYTMFSNLVIHLRELFFFFTPQDKYFLFTFVKFLPSSFINRINLLTLLSLPGKLEFVYPKGSGKPSAFLNTTSYIAFSGGMGARNSVYCFMLYTNGINGKLDKAFLLNFFAKFLLYLIIKKEYLMIFNMELRNFGKKIHTNTFLNLFFKKPFFAICKYYPKIGPLIPDLPLIAKEAGSIASRFPRLKYSRAKNHDQKEHSKP